jgi:hypothetical protein
MVSSIKRATVLLAGAGALMVIAPAGAHAAGVAPTKQLSVKQATKLQRQAARTGHYPPGPKISVKGLKRSVPAGAEGTGTRPKAPKGAKTIRIRTAKAKRLFAAKRIAGPVKAHSSLFGYQGDFFAKRNTILGYIQGFYATYVPQAGGTFQAPSLYEVNDYTNVDCGGQVGVFKQNAIYCGASNYVLWSLELSQSFWNDIGDAAWATAIAHEYGHGAQLWLGYGYGGWFQYELLREGFADCMAGAWLFSMSQQGALDGVGRGDGNEFHDLFQKVASPTTEWTNHGDFNWRYSAALYGWNYGFNGCVSWGNEIYNH